MSCEGLTKELVVTTGVDVYVPPFSEIRAALGLEADVMEEPTVTISTALFKFLIGSWLVREGFDEIAYRKANPDVDAAIRAGKVPSAQSHYVFTGYYEGRAPGLYLVDVGWYRRRYPDIAIAEKNLLIKDPQQHFNTTGRSEGRAGSEMQLRQQEVWRCALGK